MDLKGAAEAEGVDARKLERELEAGRAVVLSQEGKKPVVLSRLCRTKINTNLGISSEGRIGEEMEKLRIAEYHGTDTVMDLSTKNTQGTLKRFIRRSSVPVGTVPIYSCYPNPTGEDFLKAIEAHVKAGASFLTIHAAFRKQALRPALKRVTKIVSRGGGILAKHMAENGCENPLYANFGYILEMLRGTDVAISLGDALRPGCLSDANDKAQLMELKTQGELVLEARKAGVQVFCEGPGHMPLDTIVENVRLQKRICHGAPYYVLGPLVTDIALGYDHMNAAIGAAIAAAAGVEFLCALTPSEHYALPTLEDVREGVVAFRIAAHAADICKFSRTSATDRELSKARFRLDWTKQQELSITRKKIDVKDNAPCSMCRELCPMNMMRCLDGRRHNKPDKG
jgi:phosphomethylpyrimidine synthase